MSYTKIQLRMPKHVGEKCRKLFISSIQISKRGMTPEFIKTVKNWYNLNLIWSL